jgi:hypothetical protein
MSTSADLLPPDCAGHPDPLHVVALACQVCGADACPDCGSHDVTWQASGRLRCLDCGGKA